MGKKRRAHGEGSIFTRKDGTWVAQITTDDQADRVRYKQARARTQHEAVQKLDEMKRDQAQGRVHVPDRLTVANFLDEWVSDYVDRTLKPKTRIGYKGIISNYLKPYLGDIPLKKLRPGDVQCMVNNIYDDGIQRSAQLARSVLQSALKQAQRLRYIDINAAALCTVPKVDKKPIHPLDPDQARSFLEATKGNRLEALYMIGVSIGLREGEAFALRWEDIDLERSTLSVRHTLHRYTGGWLLQSPKTERSNRTINLPPMCLHALAAHKIRNDFERAAAGEQWQEHGFVFTSRIGTPLDGPNVLKQLHAILRRASLPIIRVHDLRHTCATLLLIRGVDARRVMELLGHSSITVTLNIYSHVLPAQKKETALQMEAILNPITDKITDNAGFPLVN